jgi:predicted membrane protein (TIGR00267 family)
MPHPKVPVLPLVLGVTDGILNALTLASGAILRGEGNGLDIGLALRVGAAACVTAAFTMFVADYAERRSALVRAGRELNLTEPGRLAMSSLGRAVARESTFAAVVAAAASLVGAAAPLLFGALVPVPAWITLAITVALLGVLGWVIGAVLTAHRWLWAASMLVGGAAVTIVGTLLDIA